MICDPNWGSDVHVACRNGAARKQQKSTRVVTQARSTSEERACVIQQEFREDLQYWIETDKKVALRILDIIADVLKHPFVGLGKPEPLKYLGSDIWSRRITAEHRLVYMVTGTRVDFLMCRYHYDR